jgi:hypothetical protein
MTCGKCGSNYILEERQYDYATRSAVYTPYCGKCGQRGRYGFVVEGKTIYPGLWAEQTKEVKVSSLKCTIQDCDKQAQKFGLCRRHFKEKHGMTLDTYNAKVVTELAAQEPEEPFADPFTGRTMGNLKRISETYQFEHGEIKADIVVAGNTLQSIAIQFGAGELWTPRPEEVPSLKALFDEVEGLCKA